MKKAFFGEFFWSRAMHLDASLTDIQWGEQGREPFRSSASSAPMLRT
ncbi:MULTISPECIES: hypothetical protein [Thauera]|nr:MULTISPECIES: hypothetical protein [Thauera]